MTTMQFRCKAFSAGKVGIHKIQVDESGVVRVWDSVAGHYTRCHSLTTRSYGKIEAGMLRNCALRPLDYCPPAIQIG